LRHVVIYPQCTTQHQDRKARSTRLLDSLSKKGPYFQEDQRFFNLEGSGTMRAVQLALIASLLGCAMLVVSVEAQTPSGETVRDRLWIWGHPAGVYNASFLAPWPRKSSIEPVPAAQWLGVPNMIFVHYGGKPEPPFDDYYRPFRKLDRVYWSLVGASGVTSAEEREHVYRLAEANGNLTGFILDDFFHVPVVPDSYPGFDPESLLGVVRPFPASLTPGQLAELGERTVRGRKLPIMAVVYTGQIAPQAKWHLDEVDEVCLWTWRPGDLKDLEANLTALEKLVPGKPIYLGCYMYDFDARRALPIELMKQQTESGFKWLKAGRIQGMIFLATPNVDVGLEAVEWTRQWIAQFGDEPLEKRGD
jgi:hypothetical protein